MEALFSFFFAASMAGGPAQPQLASASPASWSLNAERAGRGGAFEASALWPIFPGLIFQFRWIEPVTKSGHLMLGTQFDLPQDRAEEGNFSDYSVTLGWRQYVASGLHLDVISNTGWGRLRDSTITGGDYDSLDVQIQALAGWRVEYDSVYALVQPVGLAAVVYKSNPWPIEGEGTRRLEPPIYIGNILLGWQF